MVTLDRTRARGALPVAGLAAALICAGGACTVLFDPGKLDPPGPPDTADAGPGDGLVLYMLSPPAVDEGMGAVRRVPVAILGVNMAQDAMVRLTGPGQDGQPRPLQVSGTGALAVFDVAVPVLPDLADGATETVTVEVIQGEETGSLLLAVTGLDELVASDFGVGRDFTFDTGAGLLKPRYSRIEIDANMDSEGAMPLRLLATNEIVLSRTIDAGGREGDADKAGAPGPGGCRGGREGANGECGEGGGRGAPGDSQDGGGGGGHAAIGTAGQGASAAPGGMSTGTEAMTELAAEQGHGGGGGGDGTGGGGGNKGGGGGGGGGVIELRSLGTFRIESGALLSVEGGAGGGCDGDAGGGGGGSGGAILLRSASPIVDSASGNVLRLNGGQGGTDECTVPGGAGAPGRARVDAPVVPGALAGAGPYHGAVLDPATPVIVRSPTLRVTVLGRPNGAYAVASPQTAPSPVQLDGNGRGTGDVTLAPGINAVCALVTQSGVRLDDGENCLDVGYVP